MGLSKLELIGFKSFMSPVSLDFRKGITAILGPNGCGKTNIVDAVRWVLGEQSAKQLRGIKMENVIFNGTQVHKPMGCAQVHMTIDNERGVFPIDYSEITITRKVYRSGISEYFINKTPCRLKDIKELFADTGTGSHSYAVIEQEMIDFVLDDAHGERRHMFEEASGIVKYRMRREEAKRKLKLTETDLTRLDDIVEELGKQVRSLKYQMGKAKRYNTIKERVRAWELVQLRKQLSSLMEEKRSASTELARTRDIMQTGDESLGELERIVEEGKVRLVELERRNTELQNQRYEVRRQVQSSEERIIQCTERRNEAQRLSERAGREIEEAELRLGKIAERIYGIEAECSGLAEKITSAEESVRAAGAEFADITTRIETRKARLLEMKQTQLDFLQDQVRLQSSLEHYEAVLGDLDGRAGATREQIMDLERETKVLSGTMAEGEAELAGLESDVQAKRRKRESEIGTIGEIETALERNEKEFSEKRTELARLKSRNDLLVRMREDLEGFPGGARYVLKKDDDRIHGPLVELIKIEERYRPALEAVLGGMMDGVVVEDGAGAVELAEELALSNRGRVRFFVRNIQTAPETDRIADPPGLLGKLSDFITVDEAFRPMIDELLAETHLFESAEDAARFASSRTGGRHSAVTTAGIYFCAGKGIYYAGSANDEVSLLARTEEIGRIEKNIVHVQGDMERLGAECDRQRTDMQQLKRQVSGLESEINSAIETIKKKREALQEIEKNHVTKKEKCTYLLVVLDDIENSRVEVLSKLEESRLVLQMQESSDGAGEVPRLESELASLQERRAELDGTLTEQKVELASLRGTLERKREEINGLSAMETNFQSIAGQRREEIESSREESERLGVEAGEVREKIKGLLENERTCQSDLDRMLGELEENRQEIVVKDGELKKRKAERDAVFVRENEIRIKLSSLETRMTDLVERAREVHGADVSSYLEGEEIPLTEEEMDVTPDRLIRERQRLENFGPVNLAAAAEYDEKKERLEFLVSQKEDLEKAEEELTEAIRKINKRARKKFMETFENVQVHFAETFQILFEGGEAGLTLADNGDPLDADIVITARPKGKKLQDISLLSGGERALTALALLFALYMTKPSPFCIFDEVDAPLDDSNIRRFVRMLERFQDNTQFIIITHNKRTMEVANTLYGVTMEERGVSKLVSVDLEEVEKVLKDRRPVAPGLVESTISSN